MKKKIFIMLFGMYIILLFLFVIIKITDFSVWAAKIDIVEMNRSEGFWNYNIIPFMTIKEYIFESSSFEISLVNLLGNIIPFIPMGIFLGFILEKQNSGFKIFGISLVIVIIFEAIQFLTCLGSFDIDDIILNVFASLIGYTLLKIAILIFSKKYKIAKL